MGARIAVFLVSMAIVLSSCHRMPLLSKAIVRLQSPYRNYRGSRIRMALPLSIVLTQHPMPVRQSCISSLFAHLVSTADRFHKQNPGRC